MSTIRVIGGHYRSRQVKVIDANHLRPTPARHRETLFNWLNFELPGAEVLDLFAGSGILGIEALSRGAKKVTFIDHNRRALTALKQTLQQFTIPEERYEIIYTDAINWLKKSHAEAHHFSHLFIDPPFTFNYADLYLHLAKSAWLKHVAHLIIEEPQLKDITPLPSSMDHFTLHRSIKSRESRLSYYLNSQLS